MAKCLERDGVIKRFSQKTDKEKELVDSLVASGWKYVNKTAWKKQVRAKKNDE